MPDIEYLRPPGRKKYKCIAKHQSQASSEHSRWIDMNIEKHTFDNADYGNFAHSQGLASWICTSQGNMYGLQQDYSDVGTDKQQFAFFQKPANLHDEWHGFPIIPFSKTRYAISDNLLKRWVDEEVISADDIPTILKKKRI